jgi:hypothetical protein
MPDREDFRDELPPESNIEDILEWIDSGDADRIFGHVGERGDSGFWNSFDFEIFDTDLEQHTIRLTDIDLPADWDWHDFFDYLEWYADEHDVDYDNAYGEH